MKEDAGTARKGRCIDGAVFALLGLLIAFTFSGASSRFDTRRQLIVGDQRTTQAYLRVDLLPAALQPPLRESFAATGFAVEVTGSCRMLRRPKNNG